MVTGRGHLYRNAIARRFKLPPPNWKLVPPSPLTFDEEKLLPPTICNRSLWQKGLSGPCVLLTRRPRNTCQGILCSRTTPERRI